MPCPSRPGIYLDWNATTPPLPEVVRVLSSVVGENWGNPSSIHSVGRRARMQVEEAREALAALLEVDPPEIVLTSGGTEANNLALRGAVALATSRIEHPSIVKVADELQAVGRPVEWLPVTAGGQVDPDGIEPALRRLPHGATVAVAAINHETGVLQPLADIAKKVWSAGGRLHVDAVQALGKIEPPTFTQADSIAVAAHKIRGPKGIGALVWHGAPPHPLLLGGAQERGLRAGTQDAALSAGFRVAIEHARTTPGAYEDLAPLRDRVDALLLLHGERNGDEKLRAPHVTNISVVHWRGDELVAALDLEGVQVSSGSACSAGTAEQSPVITAICGPERARTAIRVSMGETTTGADIDLFLEILRRVLTERG